MIGLLVAGFILLVSIELFSTQSIVSNYYQVRRYSGKSQCIIDKPTSTTKMNSVFDCSNRCSLTSSQAKCVSFNYRTDNRTCELFNSMPCHYDTHTSCISWIRLNLAESVDYPNDCWDILKRDRKSASGVYSVKLVNEDKIIQVYCDMATDGGGWTVFQRRIDGSENFKRNWSDYADGFGNLCKDFWLGNDNLADITNRKSYQLRINLRDFNGRYGYAQYNSCKIGTAQEKYKLTFTNGSYEGSIGDSLSYHWGMNFTTQDQDNDAFASANCAKDGWLSGWWYRSCTACQLNGDYNSTSPFTRIGWSTWTRHAHPFRFTEMKIRPQQFN